MTVNIPHGQQPDRLEGILEELMKEIAKGDLFVARISSYSDTSGAMTFKVEIEETPARHVARQQSQPPPIWQPPKAIPAVPRTPTYPSGSGATGPTRQPLPHRVSTDVVTGFRDFEVQSIHDGFYLASRNKAMWRPRKRTVAYCTSRGLAADHDAPGEHCECGIYAFNRPDHPDLKGAGSVWGEIAMWGEVFVCEDGYRAEYAYPTNLFMRDTGTKGIRYVASELEQTYGVPVFLLPERAGQTAAQIIEEILSGSFQWETKIQTELDQATIDMLLNPPEAEID